MLLSDLAVEVFLILRETFFLPDGSPNPFSLRDKRNTQDDPLDEYIAQRLGDCLADAQCQKASGPLISPDLVVYRRSAQTSLRSLASDPTAIVAIEVKKLERAPGGQIARPTGLDYNTTPPCGTVRVYDADDVPLDIRAYYLFVCQEIAAKRRFHLSALALCDGNMLNEDFDLYLRVTGQREKKVGLGSYADGADRNRPMLIFSNPLGAPQLDHACTLVAAGDPTAFDSRLGLAYRIARTIPGGGRKGFFAHRKLTDIPLGWQPSELVDPFPQPAGRISATQARGRFRLRIRASGQGDIKP